MARLPRRERLAVMSQASYCPDKGSGAAAERPARGHLPTTGRLLSSPIGWNGTRWQGRGHSIPLYAARGCDRWPPMAADWRGAAGRLKIPVPGVQRGCTHPGLHSLESWRRRSLASSSR